MHRQLSQLFIASGLAVAIPLWTSVPSFAQLSDPLDDTAAYSLSVRPGGWDRSSYFPLGMLFPRDRQELISYGFDFTEQDAGPLIGPGGSNIVMDWLVRRHDKPCPPQSTGNFGFFVASWPWHLMPKNVNLPGYGTFSDSTSYFDPGVRKYLIDSDAALAKIYGGSSSRIVMWSLDNEWEGALDYSPTALTAFQEWLRLTYKSLPTLNASWGANYADWSAVVPPKDEPVISRPAAWLDWHSFQDGYFTQLMADRCEALYDNDPQHRGVAQKTTQQSFDSQTVGKQRVLDPALFCDQTRKFGGWYGVDIYDADDSYVYQVNFAEQCIRPIDGTGDGRLFLTETNNHGGPGWQFANSIWRTLANGVKAYDFYDFGMIGAPEDPATYGFTAPNGLLRDKAPYAVRFAYDVRRSEDFWTRCKPAAHLRKVAILLNRQDMLLDDDIPGQMWAGPIDNRSNVYSALRQAGYWVDVLPYTKLNAAFLKQYAALLVVNGNHLTSTECSQITAYVKQGGKLVADTLAGYYDEHHRAAHGLDSTLGVSLNEPAGSGGDSISIGTTFGNLTVKDFNPPTQHAARVIVSGIGGAPVIFKNQLGLGEAYYVDAGLGEMSGDSADTYTRWLGGLLKEAGIAPGCTIDGGNESAADIRVEQPVVDGDNAAIVAASLSRQGQKASTVEIQMPPGEWHSALWSPAEDETLVPVPIVHLGVQEYAFKLPPFATAGMILLFNNHAPLISVSVHASTVGVDGSLPVLAAGKATVLTAAILNTSSSQKPSGWVSVRALSGWSVSPSLIKTPALAPHGVCEVKVAVTPPLSGILPADERMYPINIRWSDGSAYRSVTTIPVGVAVDPASLPVLLTGNAQYPTDFPRQVDTGATYSYPPISDGSPQTVADPASGTSPHNSALFGGYSRWLMDSESARISCSPSHPATIDFDLKAAYPLHAVRLLSSEFGGYPTKMDVLVSSDGVHFAKAGSAVPNEGPGSGAWLDVNNLDGVTARYVRLNVALQNGDGLINEVEIWGYRSR